MTDAQKLEALIQKAIDGGFYSFADGMFGNPEFVVIPEDKFGQIKVHVKGWPAEYQSAEKIIFNHDFAKALFGEEQRVSPAEAPKYGISVGGSFDRGGMNMFEVIVNPGWRHHLQQAVVSDDPIDYMYKAIFGDGRI